MRPVVFWVITQQVVITSYRRLRTAYWSHLLGSSHLQGLSSWPLKMGPIGFPEVSMINYHYLLHNYPEECISQIISHFPEVPQWLWLQFNSTIYKKSIICIQLLQHHIGILQL
jgi:hypothetical protein